MGVPARPSHACSSQQQRKQLCAMTTDGENRATPRLKMAPGFLEKSPKQPPHRTTSARARPPDITPRPGLPLGRTPPPAAPGSAHRIAGRRQQTPWSPCFPGRLHSTRQRTQAARHEACVSR